MRPRGLSRTFAAKVPGHFFATMVLMGPAALGAIVALQQLGLAARTPIWVIPTILIGGQACTIVAHAAWESSPTRLRMHLRVGAQALVAGAVIYVIGWGPALAIGLVLVGQEALAVVGPSAQKPVLVWNVCVLAAGQGLIALGVLPSLIPAPEVHGLAILAALGVVFSYRSLHSALIEKESAAKLTEQRERRFRALVQSSQDLVFVLDSSGVVTYASPSCKQILGFDPSIFIGPDKADFVHSDDRDALGAAIGEVRARAGWRVELLFRVCRRDGEWRWVDGVATNLLGDEAVAGIVINARDVTERLATEAAIRHQALHDPLTGLANRALFNDRLQGAIERSKRLGSSVAVMIADLDGFKTLNDSLGHQIGDELLIAVADRLNSALRPFETIARLGGDEFAILVEDLATPDDAGRVAQRVLDALSAPIELANRVVAIGASIGIAIAERDESATKRLLSDADTAMYRAKREGKGGYRVFETSMHTAAVERLELEQDLRVALAHGELAAHYQPIINLQSGAITGFEALARWRHPQKGLVPPDVFIPIAEETNLILDLGRSILGQACAQTSQWRDEFPQLDLSIAVNISRLHLADPSLLTDIHDALAQFDLPPTVLIVEITESVLADNFGRIRSTLDRLRNSGIRVAIDDFGTGYSSFATLAELPIDILKIDKRFIDNIAQSEQGRGFVSAIIQLARTLQLETVAEGVEHPEQQAALSDLGSTHVQGHLHAPPLTDEQTRTYLEQHQPVLASSLTA